MSDKVFLSKLREEIVLFEKEIKLLESLGRKNNTNVEDLIWNYKEKLRSMKIKVLVEEDE